MKKTYLSLALVGAISMTSSSTNKVENTSSMPQLKDGCVEMTPITMAEVLTEYDIHRASVPPLGFPYVTHLFGVTNYGTKKILINDIYELELQKQAVIHEFYHALHRKYGYKNDEGTIRECTDKVYKGDKND